MEAILNAFSNESVLVVVGLLWGLLVKFHPRFAKVPNRLIPYMNVLIALLARIAVPEAHAANGALASGVGFVGSVLASVWTSTKAALMYEIFLRAHINLPVPRE